SCLNGQAGLGRSATLELIGLNGPHARTHDRRPRGTDLAHIANSASHSTRESGRAVIFSGRGRGTPQAGTLGVGPAGRGPRRAYGRGGSCPVVWEVGKPRRGSARGAPSRTR